MRQGHRATLGAVILTLLAVGSLTACASRDVGQSPGAQSSVTTYAAPLSTHLPVGRLTKSPPGSAHASGSLTWILEEGPSGQASSVAPPPPPLTFPAPPTAPPDPWNGPAAEKSFAWAEADDSVMADATIALIHGLTPTKALTVLAPHPAVPLESASAVQNWVENSVNGSAVPTALVAGDIGGGWTLVVERSGFQATDLTVLRRLSAAGAALVVFDDINALSQFSYARSGTVIRSFDPLLYHQGGVGSILPQERGIRFGADDDLHPMAQSLLLVQRLTGVRLTEATLQDTDRRIGVGILN